MRRIFETARNAKENVRTKAERKLYQTLCRVYEVMNDDKGFDGISERSIIIIGVIVVGAAFIGAMLYFFRDTLLPQITQKITDLFNIS